jgi:hypothetical protein
MNVPFNGQVDRRIGHLRQMARGYRIDGAVNP